MIGAAVEEQKYADVVAILNKLIKAGTVKPNMIEQIIQILLEENRFTDVTTIADKLVKEIYPGKNVEGVIAYVDLKEIRKVYLDGGLKR